MSAWGAAFGGPLDDADLGAVVAFVRAWGREPRAALDEAPSAGSAARGAPLYADRCAKCHGAQGVGGTSVAIGDPAYLRGAGNGYLRRAIHAGRRDTAMAGFGAALGDGGVEDVLALLRAWQAAAPPPAAAAAAPRPPPFSAAAAVLNPEGPEAVGFRAVPAFTSADIVKAQLDLGARMIILDARAPSDYAREHIAGAVNMPFYDPGPNLRLLPRDVWLVCYCGCPHAESGQLAQKLAAEGYSKVAVIDEGFRFWKKQRYPVRDGNSP
jgi:cytochrome c oxidase cbb3-type subunit 3/ubiquinol-cytochrome c reductase cytochrome c subunit